jgi:TolA-binding protein
MFFRLLVLVVFSVAASAMSAQISPASSEQQPSNQVLLERIEQLEKRISELEARQCKQANTRAADSTTRVLANGRTVLAGSGPILQVTADHTLRTPVDQTIQLGPNEAARADASEIAQAAPAASVRATSGTAGLPHDERPLNPATVQEAEIHYPSLHIRGFADVDFSATDQKGLPSGFSVGQFVLHFASPLSEKVSYFGEVSLTATPTAYDLAVERTIIKYDYNDAFKLSFGKYHTPVSYWNTAFHHGAWLQTTIARPQMVRFGGTFIPVHFVGLQTEGNIPSGGLGLGYNLGLGNGRYSAFSKAGDAGDINDNRAWVANLFARPARLYGLEVGGSFYHDKLTPKSGLNFNEWIASAHVVYTKEKPEILAEYANVHHQDLLTNQTFNTTGYYVQLAYRFPWQESKWKPYYRFEYIHRPAFEPVWDVEGIASVTDLVGSLVGVRYDITSYAAFKGEYRGFRQGMGEPRVNGAFLQTAFTF